MEAFEDAVVVDDDNKEEPRISHFSSQRFPPVSSSPFASSSSSSASSSTPLRSSRVPCEDTSASSPLPSDVNRLHARIQLQRAKIEFQEKRISQLQREREEARFRLASQQRDAETGERRRRQRGSDGETDGEKETAERGVGSWGRTGKWIGRGGASSEGPDREDALACENDRLRQRVEELERRHREHVSLLSQLRSAQGIERGASVAGVALSSGELQAPSRGEEKREDPPLSSQRTTEKRLQNEARDGQKNGDAFLERAANARQRDGGAEDERGAWREKEDGHWRKALDELLNSEEALGDLPEISTQKLRDICMHLRLPVNRQATQQNTGSSFTSSSSSVPESSGTFGGAATGPAKGEEEGEEDEEGEEEGEEENSTGASEEGARSSVGDAAGKGRRETATAADGTEQVLLRSLELIMAQRGSETWGPVLSPASFRLLSLALRRLVRTSSALARSEAALFAAASLGSSSPGWASLQPFQEAGCDTIQAVSSLLKELETRNGEDGERGCTDADPVQAARRLLSHLEREQESYRHDFVSAFQAFWILFSGELERSLQCSYTPARLCAFLDFLHVLFSRLPGAFVAFFLHEESSREAGTRVEYDGIRRNGESYLSTSFESLQTPREGDVLRDILHSVHTALKQLDPALPDYVEDVYLAGQRPRDETRRRLYRHQPEGTDDGAMTEHDISKRMSRLSEPQRPSPAPLVRAPEAPGAHCGREGRAGDAPENGDSQRSSLASAAPRQDPQRHVGTGARGNARTEETPQTLRDTRTEKGLSGPTRLPGDEQLPRYPTPFFYRLASSPVTESPHSYSFVPSPPSSLSSSSFSPASSWTPVVSSPLSAPASVPPLWAFSFILNRMLRLFQSLASSLLLHQHRLLHFLRSLDASTSSPGSLTFSPWTLHPSAPLSVSSSWSSRVSSSLSPTASSLATSPPRPARASAVPTQESRRNATSLLAFRELCRTEARAAILAQLQRLEERAFSSFLLLLDAEPSLHELLQLHALTDPPKSPALAPSLLTSHPAVRNFLESEEKVDRLEKSGHASADPGRPPIPLFGGDNASKTGDSLARADTSQGSEQSREREFGNGETDMLRQVECLRLLLEACIIQFQHPPEPLFDLRLSALRLIRDTLLVCRYSFGQVVDDMRRRRPRSSRDASARTRGFCGSVGRVHEGADIQDNASASSPLRDSAEPRSPSREKTHPTCEAEASIGTGSPPRHTPVRSPPRSTPCSSSRSRSSSLCASGLCEVDKGRERIPGRDLLHAVSLFVSAEATHWMQEEREWLFGPAVLQAASMLRRLSFLSIPKKCPCGHGEELRAGGQDGGWATPGERRERPEEGQVEDGENAGKARKPHTESGRREKTVSEDLEFPAWCANAPMSMHLLSPTWDAPLSPASSTSSRTFPSPRPAPRKEVSEVAALRLREAALSLFAALLTLPNNEEIFLGSLDHWTGSSPYTPTLIQRVLLLAWSLVLPLSTSASSFVTPPRPIRLDPSLPLYDPVALQRLLFSRGSREAGAVSPQETPSSPYDEVSFQLLLQTQRRQQSPSLSFPSLSGSLAFSAPPSSPSLLPRLSFSRRNHRALQGVWGSSRSFCPLDGQHNFAQESDQETLAFLKYRSFFPGACRTCVSSAASRSTCSTCPTGASTPPETPLYASGFDASFAASSPALSISYIHLCLLSPWLLHVHEKSFSSVRRDLLLSSLRSVLSILTHNVLLRGARECDGRPVPGQSNGERECRSERPAGEQQGNAVARRLEVSTPGDTNKMQDDEESEKRKQRIMDAFRRNGNLANEHFLSPDTLGRTWPILRALCGTLEAQMCAAGGSCLADFQPFASLLQAALQ
ncbi:hypothetical protein TGME49_285480 [Toxoplasma gondii ME49]|uniref:Uncharacterized protein n=1 Tax=Toxoplasma gondii (strain ATCC 50611 / Me49) TaxID=508771 RepID=S8GGW1_TOXGM|nr:hypothetical protein TGME49_285480 [Toxoplasma gondii ME49]EPT31100.1 hypothetical protein TGME49_285480 [Toxoplasma gondii ME49]|eukprot:XP_018637817.1 hypothetical protein TGME49_285480 [Toxoplasma gondii ME49]